jgi:hypothetical protein
VVGATGLLVAATAFVLATTMWLIVWRSKRR